MTRPEVAVAHLLLERVDQGPEAALRALEYVDVEYLVERLELVAYELIDPVELLLEFRFRAEVPHGALRTVAWPPAGYEPGRITASRRSLDLARILPVGTLLYRARH
jgi:hypothetical protein